MLFSTNGNSIGVSRRSPCVFLVLPCLNLVVITAKSMKQVCVHLDAIRRPLPLNDSMLSFIVSNLWFAFILSSPATCVRLLVVCKQ